VFRLRDFYLRIKEPRVQRIAFLLLYALLAVIGIGGFVSPPAIIEAALGWLTPFWAGFSLLGGAVGAVTVLPGWWWAERIAAAAGVFGSLIYGSVIVAVHFHSDAAITTHLGYACIPIVLLAYRLWETRRYDYEPRG